jgi:hypothetical protein
MRKTIDKQKKEIDDMNTAAGDALMSQDPRHMHMAMMLQKQECEQAKKRVKKNDPTKSSAASSTTGEADNTTLKRKSDDHRKES